MNKATPLAAKLLDLPGKNSADLPVQVRTSLYEVRSPFPFIPSSRKLFDPDGKALPVKVFTPVAI